jgi:putative MATE family efflux protein
MENRTENIPENKMGVMPVNRLLLSMSIPLIIAMIVQALYNVVDSIFVARLGENALAAVSLAFPIQSLIIGVGTGTGVGMNALLSRSLGEKNIKQANQAALHGIFLGLLSAVIFMIVGAFFTRAFFASQTTNPEIINFGWDYLFVICVFSIPVFAQITFERLLVSTGKSFYAMISQMVGAVTNIILDPIMIFGLFGFPKWGVAGAAIATVLGQLFGACLALWFNLRFNHELKLSLKGFRPSLEIIKKIYSVGLPSILMSSMGSIMVYGINAILISFTSTAAAVFGVYFKLQSYIFMTVVGLNNAMVPILAYNFGARRRARIISTICLSLAYASLFMLIGIASFNFIPNWLLLLFDASPDMLAIGVPALRIISIHYLFAGSCIISLSIFQALGQGMASLIVAGSRQLLLLLPIAWLLSFTKNINAVWWSFPITEFLTLLLCAFFLRRIYHRQIKGLSQHSY